MTRSTLKKKSYMQANRRRYERQEAREKTHTHLQLKEIHILMSTKTLARNTKQRRISTDIDLEGARIKETKTTNTGIGSNRK